MTRKTICQKGEGQAKYMAFQAFPHENGQTGEIVCSSLDKETFIEDLNKLVDPEDLSDDEVCICKTLPLEIEIKITKMPEMTGMNCGFLITEDIATLVLSSFASALKEKLEETLQEYVRNSIRLVAGRELRVELKMDLGE
jgi:hypothetical protein